MTSDCLKKMRTVIPKEHIFLIILFVLGMLVRMKGLTLESLRNDELWTIWFSSGRYVKSFAEMLHISTIKFFDVPPLYIMMMRFWIKAFGDSEVSVRLPSVIFGSLSIPIFYLLLRKIISSKISVISTLLLIFLPIHIHYSQEARNYSLFFFLSLLSMFFYFNIINAKKKRHAAGYIFSTALMVYTHYFALFLIIAQILYVLCKKKDRGYWIMVFSSLALSLLPLMVPLYMRSIFPDEIVGSWIKKVGIWEGFTAELFFFSPYLNAFPINYVFITLFIVGFIKTALNSFMKRISLNHFLFLWFLLPICIPLILTQLAKPLFVERYAIVSLAPFIIYVSMGIDVFIKNKYIALFILLLFIFLPFRQDRNRMPTENFEDWRVTATKIAEENLPVLPYPDTPATRMGIEYYSKNNTVRLINQKQLNGYCEKKFTVVSRYVDVTLHLKCKYTKKSVKTINPPFIFQYELKEG